MITTTDIAPLAGTVGDGFFVGLLTGYAIKKVLKLAAIIIGLFVAALAYLGINTNPYDYAWPYRLTIDNSYFLR